MDKQLQQAVSSLIEKSISAFEAGFFIVTILIFAVFTAVMYWVVPPLARWVAI